MNSLPCKQWHGIIRKTGYGQISLRNQGKRRVQLAHRYIWEQLNGPIPPGMVIRHKCDNPGCVEPSHLLLGTHADNANDKMCRGRHPRSQQTHCKNGHEFTPENTCQRKDRPERICRTCKRANARASYHRHKR